MSDTAVTAFLDRERTFDLLPKLEELERIVDAPAGAIVKRIVAADFRALDCPSVVRLALIGAGETPKDAAALVAEYVTGRPLIEGHALATTIVLAAWAGVRPAVVEPAAPEDSGLVLDDGRGGVFRVTETGLEDVGASDPTPPIGAAIFDPPIGRPIPRAAS